MVCCSLLVIHLLNIIFLSEERSSGDCSFVH